MYLEVNFQSPFHCPWEQGRNFFTLAHQVFEASALHVVDTRPAALPGPVTVQRHSRERARRVALALGPRAESPAARHPFPSTAWLERWCRLPHRPQLRDLSSLFP